MYNNIYINSYDEYMLESHVCVFVCTCNGHRHTVELQGVLQHSTYSNTV